MRTYKSVLLNLAILLLVEFLTSSQPVKAQSRKVLEVTGGVLKDTTLAIIVDPKTQNSYNYKIVGKTILKYDSRGTMVQSVKFSRRVTSRSINRHVKADARQPSVVYLYPHPSGGGYIFDCDFFIRVYLGIDSELELSSAGSGCQDALCAYVSCAVLASCKNNNSKTELRGDACSKCYGDDNCTQIPTIKPARVVSIRPNAGANPNQEAIRSN